MNTPLRYILSFFREEVLETSSSAFNERLEVWYAWGKTIVNSSNVNMSYGSLDTVFREAFRKLGVLDKPWKDVLLLGLGAGNVAQILQERPGKFQITGVEIDPEMIRLANKWCKMDQIPGLEIVNDDALRFVKDCNQKYDLVVIDLFLDRLVPEEAESQEFLRNAAGLLRPGGMLLFNRLMHEADLKEQTLIFTRRMQDVLPGTRFVQAHSNRMLVYEKK